MNAGISQPFRNARIGQQPLVLEHILQPAINIAIYQRDISSLKEELDQLQEKTIECRESGDISKIKATLIEYLSENDLELPGLLEDIENQLKHFKHISKATSFRLLFKTVHTNMCRRFHTDINALRLLCTYKGQGTMWLPDEYVNHKAFLVKGNNQQIAKNDAHIQQVKTGDVVVLKGALFPNSEAIVHRSPTIEESGENRLLLRIDTNDDLNF